MENHAVSRLRPLVTSGLPEDPLELEPEAGGRGARRRVAAVAFPLVAPVAQLVEHARHEQEHRLGRRDGALQPPREVDPADLDHAVGGIDAHQRCRPDGAVRSRGRGSCGGTGRRSRRARGDTPGTPRGWSDGRSTGRSSRGHRVPRHRPRTARRRPGRGRRDRFGSGGRSSGSAAATDVAASQGGRGRSAGRRRSRGRACPQCARRQPPARRPTLRARRAASRRSRGAHG